MILEKRITKKSYRRMKNPGHILKDCILYTHTTVLAILILARIIPENFIAESPEWVIIITWKDVTSLAQGYNRRRGRMPSQPIVFRRASDVTSLNVIIITHEGDSALIPSELINIYQENGQKIHFYCIFRAKQLCTIFVVMTSFYNHPNS